MTRLMQHLGPILLLHACATKDPTLSLSATTPPVQQLSPSQAEIKLLSPHASLPSCDTLVTACPEDERKIPYRCTANRLRGDLLRPADRYYAWGNSLCQARRGLLEQVCQQKLEPNQLAELACGPDPSSGSCPTTLADCPAQKSPSRCSVIRYRKIELPWTERPYAWGENECLARQNVLVSTCQLGLDPNLVEEITCQDDPAPGQCPPKADLCPNTKDSPTVCRVSKFGEITFKKPWQSLAINACEAQLQLKELACRFVDSANKLTLDQLGSMECQSLVDFTESL